MDRRKATRKGRSVCREVTDEKPKPCAQCNGYGDYFVPNEVEADCRHCDGRGTDFCGQDICDECVGTGKAGKFVVCTKCGAAKRNAERLAKLRGYR